MKRAGGRQNFTKISIRHIRKFILYISVQFAVVCILMEIYGRLFDPFGISYYPEMSAYLDTMIIEEPIGYRNRPNLNGNYFGVPVTINSLGMRDREVSRNDDGEFRILFMGDSLPFGVGVRYEDSLPYKLEEVLNSRRRGNPYFHYRTLNMGVISYNTEQELIQLKQIGLLLKPRLAILVYSDNDIEPKMFIFNKRRKWYLNLGQRSYAVSLIYTLAENISKRNSVLNSDDRAMNQYYAERWSVVDNSLHEINTLLRSKGVHFVLFTTEKRGIIFDLLRNAANREGFPLVTLDYRQDLMKFRNSYIDAHPNKAGNEFLAELIAEALEREGVLDHSGEVKDKNESAVIGNRDR